MKGEEIGHYPANMVLINSIFCSIAILAFREVSSEGAGLKPNIFVLLFD